VAVSDDLQFLMDDSITFKNPGNLSYEEAATVGVGLLVSVLRICVDSVEC
jgi:hypothetical protein